MSKYTFFATIRPENTVLRLFENNLYIPIELQHLQVMFGDSIIGFNTKVIVFNSQILVEIVDIDENFDLLELRNIIRELIVLPIVDALNYLFGQGFDVDMTSVITPSEEHLFFDVSITEIWENRSERPLEFRDLLNLLFQSQHLRRALW